MKKKQHSSDKKKLLAVAVIAFLLALAGWLIWQSNSKDDTPTLTDQTTNTNKEPVRPGFLTLDEFRVRIPLSDRTRGLKLGPISASSSNPADKTVPIIASELDSDWTCAATTTSGKSFKGTIGNISVTTQAKRSGAGEPVAPKTIKGHTLGFEPGGSNCTKSAAYKQLVDEFKVQFGKIEPN